MKFKLDSSSEGWFCLADTRKLFIITHINRSILLYLINISVSIVSLLFTWPTVPHFFLVSCWDKLGFPHVLAVSIVMKSRPLYPWCSQVCRLWLAAAYRSEFQLNKSNVVVIEIIKIMKYCGSMHFGKLQRYGPCVGSGDWLLGSHRGGPVSTPGQSTWELWWTIWHWGRFFCGYCGFFCQYQLRNC